tara:strand:+ start:1071 stop:2183 length:1113 start_codon:yes stop_codon:yes gene_type:complete
MTSFKLLKSTKACITLNYYCYHNPKLVNFLVQNFDSLHAISNHQNDITNHFKLKHTNFFDALESFQTNQYESYLKSHDINILTLNDLEYPNLLKQITCPPPILFYKGTLSCLSEKKLAIIGPRKPSPYAKEVSIYFTENLCQDFCIVSGFADGIDAIAHHTTLQNNQTTIAVMGVGLDKCYPSHHKKLKQDIINKQGLLLSEIPLFSTPQKFHFPLRNRIISGLCKGVIITEAAPKSGSLITANYALEQNREIFAIPGNIFEKTSKGVHDLIKQGAKCTTSPEDIYDEFNIKHPKHLNNSIPKKKKEVNMKTLTENEKIIIQCIKKPKHIDELVCETQLSISELLHTLTFLEIKKMVTKTDGSLYVLETS